MNNRKRNQKKKPKPSYYVFVEGETEKAYLNEFKNDLNNEIALHIRPELKSCDLLCSHKKSADDVIEKLRDTKQIGYDKVFYVFDKDVLLREDDNPKNKKKPSEKLEEMKKKLEKKDKNIVVLENSPCFELWFLLHFIQTASSFNNCDQVIDKLKKYVASFDKKPSTYGEIYKKYKGELSFAITNAKNLDRQKTESKAQIYKMIQELISKVNPL